MIQLSDEYWERIREHFAEENIPDGRPGRKPIPTRRVLEAVLWILNTGAQWHMVPQCYPNYKTASSLQNWCLNEVLRNVLADLANTLRDEGSIDESESFIDAAFASAKGGGEEMLARRTLLRLDSVAASPARPLGVLRREVPLIRSAGIYRHPAETVLR